MYEHASAAQVIGYICVMGEVQQTLAQSLGENNLFELRDLRLVTAKRTVLPFKQYLIVVSHRGEDSLAEVVRFLNSDNLRTSYQHGYVGNQRCRGGSSSRTAVG